MLGDVRLKMSLKQAGSSSFLIAQTGTFSIVILEMRFSFLVFELVCILQKTRVRSKSIFLKLNFHIPYLSQ